MDELKELSIEERHQGKRVKAFVNTKQDFFKNIQIKKLYEFEKKLVFKHYKSIWLLLLF